MPESPSLGYVILHYAFSDLTHTCLASIAQHAPSAPLLVVDNGSPEPFQGSVPILYLPENRCLAAAMNAGTNRLLLEEHGVDVAVQLNNDVVLSASTDPQLRWAFASLAELGVASPLVESEAVRVETDRRDAGFMFHPCPHPPGPAAESYLAATLPPHQVEIVPFVDNVAFAIRRQTWLEVGPLEERFSGASWGANYDYCWRARALGWETGLVRSAFIFHRHRATWGRLDSNYSERSGPQMMQEMREIWGDLAETVSCRRVIWDERQRLQDGDVQQHRGPGTNRATAT